MFKTAKKKKERKKAEKLQAHKNIFFMNKSKAFSKTRIHTRIAQKHPNNVCIKMEHY